MLERYAGKRGGVAKNATRRVFERVHRRLFGGPLVRRSRRGEATQGHNEEPTGTEKKGSCGRETTSPMSARGDVARGERLPGIAKVLWAIFRDLRRACRGVNRVPASDEVGVSYERRKIAEGRLHRGDQRTCAARLFGIAGAAESRSGDEGRH